MGGCCCSARKPHLQGAPVYYYCPPTFEERESLTSNDGTNATVNAGFLVGLNLEASIPDTFQPPPLPLPYDMVLGGPASSDSESGRETVSSFETSITPEYVEESDNKAQANSAPTSPRKAQLPKLNVTHVLVTEEEDVCPICLEEYDVENPRNLTKCEHHFHLSCILEWMERSDYCPICDQVMDDLFDSSLNLEDTHYKEGYDEGYSHGLVAGKEEARHVGLKVGFEVGEELGFYRGCVDIWTSAIRLDPTCFSPRAKTIIGQMEELIQKYPLMDPENVQVQEIMDSLRLKFKMVCSSLRIKLEYNGYPKSSNEANDIQF